jgi:hypothetical protein
MYKQSKILLKISCFIIMLLLFSNLSFAQGENTSGMDIDNHNDFAKKHAKNLQAVLNLTDDQTSKVEDILNEYKDNVQNSNNAGSNDNNASMGTMSNSQTSADDQITSVLDTNQKASWAQVKNNWWSSVNQDIGTVNQNQQNNTY